MAYSIQKPEHFLKKIDIYLSEHPLNPSYEENLINNFSSNNLSDLYKLFLDLSKSTLTSDLYNKLYETVSANFSSDIANSILTSIDENLLTFSISKSDINSLEEIIKDTFLSNKMLDLNSDETYKLSLIVNKVFPEVFLGFIDKPNNEIKEQQSFIQNKILDTLDHWHLHNSKEAERENIDIAGAIRITAKKLYPDLKIYIPGRIKSTKSSVANISKEVKNSLSKLHPSDPSTGLSTEDIKNQFNLEGANSDFSGLTIVLDHTDDTLHFDKNDPRSLDILKLRKASLQNINFSHTLENFLQDNEACSLSNIDLLQIKIDLLTRLRDSTYEECIREYNNTSFEELLKEAIEEYKYELHSPSQVQACDDEIDYLIEMDNIYQLLDELKKRVFDKYQAKLLEVAIPDVLNDPEFTENLKVKSVFVKNVKKPNGFCSQYYCLETLDGRKIELQAQSKKRFNDSKNGSSDHSLLPNKEIDISKFFEPVDCNCDEKQFRYFLDILKNTPIATKNFLYNTPDLQLSPIEKRNKRKLKVAEQNIKLKEHYEVENMVDGVPQKSEYTLKEYLPIFAEYVSPTSTFVVGSYHTRVNTSVAGYNKKSLIDGFSEVLLKRDNTTCLAQQLIDKLEELMPSDKNKLSLNGINKRAALRHGNKNISDSDDEIEK